MALPLAADDSGLVGRIKWTTLARVVLTTGVLAFAVAVDLGLTPQRSSATAEVLLYQVSAVTYAASFVLLLLTQLLLQRSHALVAVAWASAAVDIATALVLVHVTDGLQSLFLFSLPLAVLNAAVLRSLTGAVAAASLAALGMSVQAAHEMGWVALPSWRVAYLTTLAPRPPLDGFEVATGLALQVAAAYGTAVLASLLVRELDRARGEARRQGEQAAALQVRYDDVVSSLPDGVLTIDASATITSANPAAARILRCDQAAIGGCLLTDLLPGLQASLGGGASECEIARVVPADPQQTQQVLRTTSDGATQILACRVVPLRGATAGPPTGDPLGRLVLVRDLTAVRAREAQHHARERLAAVGAMAAAVAHEIRNPLAAISGSVELLHQGGGQAPTDAALMQIVVRETAQLSAWIGEFLDFARPRPLQRSHCDLEGLVNETVGACQTGAHVQQHGIALAVRVAVGGDWRIQADAVLLRQVLWNLLVNACHAVEGCPQRHVEVSLASHRGGVELAVDDSGPGIGPAERDQIFEPFYTTKDRGTGLGLATVRRHVEAHDGRIHVAASPLGGARMVVWLPQRPSSGGFVLP